ncbi:MAG: nucleoside-diphosphate-sugar epimerase [Candidatus Taylorbacteria bacterium]|nr:nucleoside-diphosphate-sugar epimerase [Candidatus Taylorbacteria bacterium]
MKYIVTGGAGFIGSHIVDALISEGHSVAVIDDLSTGSKANLNPKASFHKCDTRNFAELTKTFSTIKAAGGDAIDGVFHLAAYPSVPYSIEHPIETYEINMTGMMHVLEAARENGARCLVYSASSAAYGDQEQLPHVETMEPRLMSPYALHKYAGELMCASYSRTYGMSTASLRYFNVYGPRQRSEGAYAGVISKFLAQRSEGKPLILTGDGSQTRDFVHVSDVARANLISMAKLHRGELVSGDVFNIGSGIESSVKEIAAIFGGPVERIAPRTETKNSRADISKAEKALGWSPTIPLEKGLGDLLKSIKSI